MKIAVHHEKCVLIAQLMLAGDDFGDVMAMGDPRKVRWLNHSDPGAIQISPGGANIVEGPEGPVHCSH